MADPIRVRATVNQRKLSAGQEALVDPADPFIQLCLKKGLLVPLDAQAAAAVAPADPSAADEDRAPDIEVDAGEPDDTDESEHPEVADLG